VAVVDVHRPRVRLKAVVNVDAAHGLLHIASADLRVLCCAAILILAISHTPLSLNQKTEVQTVARLCHDSSTAKQNSARVHEVLRFCGVYVSWELAMSSTPSDT